MNKQKLWWSEVEERFGRLELANAVALSNAVTSIKLYDRETNMYYTIPQFFHKEIQERLHEDAVDSELPK